MGQEILHPGPRLLGWGALLLGSLPAQGEELLPLSQSQGPPERLLSGGLWAIRGRRRSFLEAEGVGAGRQSTEMGHCPWDPCVHGLWAGVGTWVLGTGAWCCDPRALWRDLACESGGHGGVDPSYVDTLSVCALVLMGICVCAHCALLCVCPPADDRSYVDTLSACALACVCICVCVCVRCCAHSCACAPTA